MRDRIANWGAGLSETDFACALAALGTVGSADALWTVERLAAEIRERVGGDKLVEWRFGEKQLALNAANLAKAWRLFLLSGGSGVRIQLSRLVLQFQKIDPVWVRDRLRHPEVGAASVEIVNASGVTRSEGEIFRSGYEVEAARDDNESVTRGTQSYSYEIPDLDDSSRAKSTPPPDGSIRVGGGGGVRTAPTRSHRGRESAAKPALRFLQAQLYDRRTSLETQPILKGLRPNASCVALIRVGERSDQWTSLDRPFPTPKEQPEPQGHRLTVIFEEPRVSPDPQVQTLWLPRTGSSEPVHFPFEAPDDGWIAARVTVLHANRVLQTGLLQALIGSDNVTFKRDAMPRTRLEGLAHRGRFDAALIVDRDGRATAASENKAVSLALDDGSLRELTEFLNSQISAISNAPERYEGLESPGSVELLRSLARKGATLHEYLCEHTELIRLADARRIHITSARAESFLPAELLYRFGAPSSTAGLCPHARAALESGDCSGACPSDKRRTVCPLGFWGLSKVIERHSHEREDQRTVARDFEIRPEPVRERSLLPLSGGALLGASAKATLVKKDAVRELLEKLRKRGPVSLATTWTEWEEHIASDRPRLLVLLPHHERASNGFEILEIGDDSRLETADILEELVSRDDGLHPIVLLMGCETNLTRISFDNPAIRFRDNGAAVVVSTIATILGRHASPATAALVELLDQMADGRSTFGDVMLRLRQKLVAQATPMALGLTSYGDADWILTRKEA